jgi:hypothetical protein
MIVFINDFDRQAENASIHPVFFSNLLLVVCETNALPQDCPVPCGVYMNSFMAEMKVTMYIFSLEQKSAKCGIMRFSHWHITLISQLQDEEMVVVLGA